MTGWNVIALALLDGSVLALGNGGGSGNTPAAVFRDGQWHDVGKIPVDNGFAAVMLLDGRALIVGGRISCGAGSCSDPAVGDAYLFDPSASI